MQNCQNIFLVFAFTHVAMNTPNFLINELTRINEYRKNIFDLSHEKWEPGGFSHLLHKRLEVWYFFSKKAKRACSFIRKIRVMHDLVIVSSISSNGQNMTTCSLFRSLPTSTRPNSIMIMMQTSYPSVHVFWKNQVWKIKFDKLDF